MNIKQIAFYCLMAGLIHVGCGKKTELDEESAMEMPSQVTQRGATPVEIQVVSAFDFHKEIHSEGVVRSAVTSDVTFDVQERIEAVLVKAGQRVKQGQIIARLRATELESQVDRAKYQIKQTELKLEERLISLGYDKREEVPRALLERMELEFGLEGLEKDLEMASYRLDKAFVKAPVSGIVAEVEAQAGNPSSNYKKVCSIIDDSQFEILFPVLEAELPIVKVGSSLKINALYQAGQTYSAVVDRITPVVQENGMVQVFARMTGSTTGLVQGMKVRVKLQQTVKNQLTLPKRAVLDRQGRYVVFTVKGNLAEWNYVTLGLENSDSYTITEGLSSGDTVVVGNNFNLAHMEEVSF